MRTLIMGYLLAKQQDFQMSWGFIAVRQEAFRVQINYKVLNFGILEILYILVQNVVECLVNFRINLNLLFDKGFLKQDIPISLSV